MHLGSFSTAAEAALCIARSPEGQEAAERSAAAPPLTLERAARSGGRAPRIDYRSVVGTRDSCPSGKILARQVLDAKAAGSLQTQEALARAAGVDPSAVSRVRASDKAHAPLAAPQPKTHQILLQLDGNFPALVCTQEGRVDGESAKETHNRCNRNFTRRRAVLRAAGVAAAGVLLPREQEGKGSFVKEVGVVPPMPPDAYVKVEIVVKEEEMSDSRPKRRRTK